MAPTNRSLEIILGALVVGVAIFFGGLLLSGRPLAGGGEGKRVFAVFGNVDGIDPGATVKMSGVPIGRVIAARLEEPYFDAVVEISLNAGVSLPDDTAAKISFGSLLGGNFIELVPGGSMTMMVDGHIIEDTSDAVNLVDLISQTMFSGGVGEGNPPEDASTGFSFGFGGGDDSFADDADGGFGEDFGDSPDSDPDFDAGDGAGTDGETSAQ
ncbi:MAG: outer membrane lipid asymmetry maintenance protein MlaD [Alphaproteobacteria bacterium]|nr:outer membrane lipid asymmetry maintenance protein MlaD [Alphaproteobacteria bacterium]